MSTGQIYLSIGYLKCPLWKLPSSFNVKTTMIEKLCYLRLHCSSFDSSKISSKLDFDWKLINRSIYKILGGVRVWFMEIYTHMHNINIDTYMYVHIYFMHLYMNDLVYILLHKGGTFPSCTLSGVLKCLNLALLIYFLEVARNQAKMWQRKDKWFCLWSKKKKLAAFKF